MDLWLDKRKRAGVSSLESGVLFGLISKLSFMPSPILAALRIHSKSVIILFIDSASEVLVGLSAAKLVASVGKLEN